MTLEARILNRTYTTVGSEVLLDDAGRDVLAVVAKLSLAFQPSGALRLTARPVRTRDEPDGAGGLAFPSDVAADKPGTDLGLVATMPAPDEPADSAVVSLRMGPLSKALRVFGEREYVARGDGVAPGPARRLVRTPLVPALAFGGVDDGTRPRAVDLENPAGRGFSRDPRTKIGARAHRLELAGPPHGAGGRGPQAFFAPIPASWEPRASRAGTQDEAWRRTRAPVAPLDRDPRFTSWASDGLHGASPLVGDELIEIAGLGPPTRLALPRYPLRFTSEERGREREHPTHLDGVLIDWDERVIELVWRAAIPLPRTWELLTRVTITSTASLPEPVLADGDTQEPT